MPFSTNNGIWTGYKRINSTHYGNGDNSFPLDAFNQEFNTTKFAMTVAPNLFDTYHNISGYS